MLKTFLTLFVLLVLGGRAQAQLPVGFGLKVGAPLNDAYNIANSALDGTTIQNAYSSNAKDFLIGPMVELRLPFSISVEADALYRSVGFRRIPVLVGNTVTVDRSSWEIPILMKYKFKGIPLVRPYVGAGLSFRRVTGDDIIELTHRNSTGVVLEGGVEFKLLLLRISPEIRYSGYTVRSFEAPSGLLQTNKNQLAFLVGFTF